MKWQVGDVAIIVGADRQPEFIGYECEIKSLQSAFYDGCFEITLHGAPPHPLFRTYSIRPINLKPLPDGNEASTWEQCIWQPRELILAVRAEGVR